MKPMKPQKMWAVVNAEGLPVQFGYSKYQAKAYWRAVVSGRPWSDCEMEGYRVQKVLVTGREK